MSLQADIIKRLGVKPVIDVEQEIRTRVDFLKNMYWTLIRQAC